MAGLRLAKLPDRTPIKLTIQMPPALHDALNAYAAAYERTYGVSEPIADLVPAILATFLESDREFARVRSGAARRD